MRKSVGKVWDKVLERVREKVWEKVWDWDLPIASTRGGTSSTDKIYIIDTDHTLDRPGPQAHGR